jgi:hypothetical protein
VKTTRQSTKKNSLIGIHSERKDHNFGRRINKHIVENIDLPLKQHKTITLESVEGRKFENVLS